MKMTRAEVERQVSTRARDRGEYCAMHQSLQGATFHVEHVVPRSRGGQTETDNLAWCCPSCNLHKSDRVDVLDPQNGAKVNLFNPRTARWNDHFLWKGYKIEGQTAVGRATVSALQLNHPRRLRIRQVEERFELFPPTNLI